MLISTLRLPESFQLTYCVNGVTIEAHIENKHRKYVTHAFTHTMGSVIEVRRSVFGVNFVQPEAYLGGIYRVDISEEIRLYMNADDTPKIDRTALKYWNDARHFVQVTTL